jgi:hypothetical protein
MRGMRPEEAREFYEEDEDPAKVFVLFDAAKREGRLSKRDLRQNHHPYANWPTRCGDCCSNCGYATGSPSGYGAYPT